MNATIRPNQHICLRVNVQGVDHCNVWLCTKTWQLCIIHLCSSGYSSSVCLLGRAVFQCCTLEQQWHSSSLMCKHTLTDTLFELSWVLQGLSGAETAVYSAETCASTNRACELDSVDKQSRSCGSHLCSDRHSSSSGLVGHAVCQCCAGVQP